jgi:hypothetical protein
MFQKGPTMSARLATGVWVSAYLVRLRLAGIAYYVTAKGDQMAGAVLVKLALLNGQAQVFERGFDLEQDARVWRMVAEGPEPEMDALTGRARARDRDLWVIELEDRAGRTLLDQDGLSG